jgi:(E)-4-hydroxy-3-methylbut-2-enyl-diphosphate synthase
MTTSLTQDVQASVQQCIRLAEAGCELIRLTAPNKAAAKALRDIRTQFSAASTAFKDIPLVADIHFLPTAAMEAVEHVEKVRVNPGNYADKKKFAVLEYSDQAYQAELERLHEAFSPLVKRCKELGRALRIGTNHGSLSDRIMNRYGDTPEGMVESALEFIRIAESHGFRDIILSMKASNPKVMVQAYRLAVAKMAAEGMHYPLHLGVTEAGEGEDARIKSAIGIGALLYDGLGDTIRVSLTEDPWYEVPVCKDLVRRAEALWGQGAQAGHGVAAPELAEPAEAQQHFYQYHKRAIPVLDLGPHAKLGPLEPPRVIVPARHPLCEHARIAKDVFNAHRQLKEARCEGILVRAETPADLEHLVPLCKVLGTQTDFIVLEVGADLFGALESLEFPQSHRFALLPSTVAGSQKLSAETVLQWLDLCVRQSFLFVLDAGICDWQQPEVLKRLRATQAGSVIFTTSMSAGEHTHPVGSYRQLVQRLHTDGLDAPIWLRVTPAMQLLEEPGFGPALVEAAMFAGVHFIDGYGDLLSIETVDDVARSAALAYNLLQGARMRSIKTEFVACPSCGRTLFNLQEVTQRIKGRTGHLKGVTIAVMGCIVNGPGEMADADFGYVGGAPEKVNLYVGKTCVQFNIPEADALDRLVDLIKQHGKWNEPEAAQPVEA